MEGVDTLSRFRSGQSNSWPLLFGWCRKRKTQAVEAGGGRAAGSWVAAPAKAIYRRLPPRPKTSQLQ